MEIIMDIVIAVAIVAVVVGGFVVFARSGKRGSGGGSTRVLGRGSHSGGSGDTDNIEI